MLVNTNLLMIVVLANKKIFGCINQRLQMRTLCKAASVAN
jgi:hypothetical protein